MRRYCGPGLDSNDVVEDEPPRRRADIYSFPRSYRKLTGKSAGYTVT